MGELSVMVGGSVAVFLKEGPPARPEAYRHTVTATVHPAAAADAAAEPAAVAVVPEGGGLLQRVVCLRAGSSPLLVSINSIYTSKHPTVT